MDAGRFQQINGCHTRKVTKPGKATELGTGYNYFNQEGVPTSPDREGGRSRQGETPGKLTVTSIYILLNKVPTILMNKTLSLIISCVNT